MTAGGSHEAGPAPGTDTPLLTVRNLVVDFGTSHHPQRAVDDISLQVGRGEAVGLVGESGCGKTTTGRAVLRLEEARSGRVDFDGMDVLHLRGRALLEYRRRVQMVFQDPFGSLNPRLSVGRAIEEVLHVHRLGDAAGRRRRVDELLLAVGLDPAARGRYPHEFSGGQRQRIGLARALAVGPELVIADEPVSALDVSVQVQILNLMRDLQQQFRLSYLFVAHDLAVVRYLCHQLYVMYRGRMVEEGDAGALLARPMHPYTRMLLEAVPDVAKGLARRSSASSAGTAADAAQPATASGGCAFRSRCPLARARCAVEIPVLRPSAPGRKSACHFFEEV